MKNLILGLIFFVQLFAPSAFAYTLPHIDRLLRSPSSYLEFGYEGESTFTAENHMSTFQHQDTLKGETLTAAARQIRLYLSDMTLVEMFALSDCEADDFENHLVSERGSKFRFMKNQDGKIELTKITGNTFEVLGSGRTTAEAYRNSGISAVNRISESEESTSEETVSKDAMSNSDVF